MKVESVYAEGFLQYARETIGFDRGMGELAAVRGVFRNNPDLLDLLKNPVITHSEKLGVIETVFSSRFSEEIRNFLKLLLDKGRLSIFFGIAEYVRIKYSHPDEMNGVVDTSYILGIGQVKRIKEALEKKFGKKLHLYFNLAPDLLGGVRVAIGNIVIDASVKKRLEDLKEKLETARID